MSVYFIVTTIIDKPQARQPYDEYINKVKPIAESFGGKYIVRSEHITPLSDL